MNPEGSGENCETRFIYVVAEVGWEHNDSYFYLPSGGGVSNPLVAYDFEDSARDEARRLTMVKLRDGVAPLAEFSDGEEARAEFFEPETVKLFEQALSIWRENQRADMDPAPTSVEAWRRFRFDFPYESRWSHRIRMNYTLPAEFYEKLATIMEGMFFTVVKVRCG